MRTLLVAVLVLLGCSSPTVPPASVAGTWSDQASVSPDSAVTILNLTQTGVSIAGTATIGTTVYSVNGTYQRPRIQFATGLTFSAPYHTPTQIGFDGTAVSPTVMVISIDGGSPLHFIKR